jgi:hypothetical protein
MAQMERHFQSEDATIRIDMNGKLITHRLFISQFIFLEYEVLKPCGIWRKGLPFYGSIRGKPLSGKIPGRTA